MDDLQIDNFAVSVDVQSLVKPPISFLFGTLGVALLSSASFFINNALGYVIAVVASIIGGVTALQDQKRQGSPNYVTLQWFRPTLQVVRYLILAITIAHVLRLALAAAKGGGFLS